MNKKMPRMVEIRELTGAELDLVSGGGLETEIAGAVGATLGHVVAQVYIAAKTIVPSL